MKLRLLAALALALCAAPLPARAITVDGRLDTDYGSALATQVNDHPAYVAGPSGVAGQCNFTALDELYATIADSTLHVFVAGNLFCVPNFEGGSWDDQLYVFVDCRDGGQNPIAATFGGNVIALMNGLHFDPGFAPEYAFTCYGLTGPAGSSEYTFYVDEDAFAGSTWVGSQLGGSPAAGNGTLSGGTNPFGVRAAIDNSSLGGVPQGCGLSSGAGLTLGTELAIPLAALGNPTGCIRLSVFAGNSINVGNQVLPPFTTAVCTFGPASAMDFSAFADDQFVSVCPSAVGVEKPTLPPRLDLARPFPNPARGDLTIEFALPGAGAVSIGIFDLAGRLVRTVADGAMPAGVHTERWDGRSSDGRIVSPGVYFCELRFSGQRIARRVVIRSY